MKTLLLGVTGSIAAYKSATLAHSLKKNGINVNVIMTENATKIITPLTFEHLTSNKCVTDTFERAASYDVKHISLAQSADCILIAPATANIIGKLANGIADDMLTTTVMASKAPVYIAPAMNTAMYESPANQRNLKILESYGYHIIEPAEGLLACGDVGKGKMPEPSVLEEYIYRELNDKKDLIGKRILVSAGATCEDIDPVRYITNRSSGKMGCEIARAALRRGASVTLVAAHMETEPPILAEVVRVRSASEMFEEIKSRYENTDIVIKAAAVADYTPTSTADNKIKKKEGDLSIPLKRTEDILSYLGKNKKKQFLCGFSMETENLEENSLKKLKSKNADMIVANSLRTPGAGFATDTNVVTLITKQGLEQKDIMSKYDVANTILDKISEMMR
ncbi:MAG: bifunctional phosphopantothenoylcysteine decarboxylase/phosphopantothenate--cysteine ligase CoaBC [Firmicutes bacterium]|nr:bifunctional phosphopantothenoylcysteine decarboxylase/phosphopantothenate--cysteine ligase CoaBC [Bacillota bacterium]